MDAAAIRSFASQLRQIDTGRPALALDTAGILLAEAIRAGACSGPEWLLFRRLACPARCDPAEPPRYGFIEAVHWLVENRRSIPWKDSGSLCDVPARIHGGTAYSETFAEMNIPAIAALLEAQAAEVERLAGVEPADETPREPAGAGKGNGPATFTSAELRALTGLARTALRKYRTAAGIDAPGRGAKNHRYTRTDAVLVLRQVLRDSGEKRTQDKCRESLTRLGEMPP